MKFNQIVYLRNQNSAKYFAGFPIGFNIAIGGVDEKGNDIYNDLSLLCLKAQEHLGLPQPNLSVRLNKNTSHELMQAAIKVVSLGSGMPQFFNDEAIIHSMIDDLIIEEIGHVKAVKKQTFSQVIVIEASKVLEGTKIGDSIAVNGICLTV